MEHVDIARVVVAAAPYSIDKPYDYLVPEPLAEKVRAGVRVTVPFGRGNTGSEGIVLAVTRGGKSKALKAVSSVLDEEPVLDEDGIALAFFLRQRCFCTMYEAVKAVLPAGLWYQLRAVYRLAAGLTPEEARQKSAAVYGGESALDAVLASGGTADAEQLRSACGDGVEETLKALCKAGVLETETEASRRIRDKHRRTVELAVDTQTALE